MKASSTLKNCLKTTFCFKKSFFCIALLLFVCTCCVPSKRNIFFATDGYINEVKLENALKEASGNYVIASFDYIAVSVFTNKGEILVDPNFEFETGKNKTESTQPLTRQGTQANMFNVFSGLTSPPIAQNKGIPQNYRVNEDGFCFLPMIGNIKLAGYTLKQADSIIAEKFKAHYKEPFVVTQYTNKRVFILGALGSRVIPLQNEDISLIEVLAIAGGGGQPLGSNTGISTNLFKTNNIRIIRSYQSGTPSVQVVNLSTMQGLLKADLHIRPNDVIYIEPRRQFDLGNFQLIQVFASTVTAIITLYLLIQSLNNNQSP